MPVPEPLSIVTSLISNIFEIHNKIHRQIQLVQANKQQCLRLQERMKMIVEMLKDLHNRPNATSFIPALEKLQSLLTETSAFIEKLTIDKGLFADIVNFVRAQNNQTSFQRFNRKLETCINDLQLGLQIHLVMNHAQDAEDIKADYQAILIMEQDVLAAMRKQLDRQNQMDKRQAAYEQIVLQQLDAFRQDFKRMFDAAAPVQKSILPDNLRVPLDEVSFDKLVVNGRFAKIYMGRWHGKQVAIKQIQATLTQEEEQQFIREIQIISRLSSPYVTQFYGAYLNKKAAAAVRDAGDEQLFYVMEWAPKGNLKDVLHNETLSDELRHKISLALAQGLLYLQSRKILHRDLKPENILLTEQYEVKLTDFGLAKAATMSIATIGQRSTALNYTAPEVLRGESDYTSAAESYSYGRLLWFIWTGIEPQPRAGAESLPAAIPQPYRNLILRCLSDKTNRPEMYEIISVLSTALTSIDMPGNTLLAQPAVIDGEKLYQEGKAFESKGDEKQAVECYQGAATVGHAGGQANLATFLWQGKAGLAKDDTKALELYKTAGNSGHSRAQYMVGWMLETGRGTTENLPQALDWYEKAAAQGRSEAVKRLAFLKKG